ncbi:MAG: hypothetical protein AAF266_13000, partial [Planctomycetota bacterium]
VVQKLHPPVGEVAFGLMAEPRYRQHLVPRVVADRLEERVDGRLLALKVLVAVIDERLQLLFDALQRGFTVAHAGEYPGTQAPASREWFIPMPQCATRNSDLAGSPPELGLSQRSSEAKRRRESLETGAAELLYFE